MSERTDSELVRAYRAGETAAFETLVVRHTDPLFRYLARLVGDRDAASDITQEAFVKAWSHLNTFRESENFKTWLFTIARNSAFDWLRKKKTVAFSALEGDEPYEARVQDNAPLPDEIRARLDDGRYLEELLKELTPAVRDILLLHYVEGLTFDEIGTLRSEPLNTVKSRHRRALLSLREIARTKKRIRDV